MVLSVLVQNRSKDTTFFLNVQEKCAFFRKNATFLLKTLVSH